MSETKELNLIDIKRTEAELAFRISNHRNWKSAELEIFNLKLIKIKKEIKDLALKDL
tara:strand:+ start:769 stop:939 length:171 start_codon:yes stop_codon:yes gene_type:complete